MQLDDWIFGDVKASLWFFIVKQHVSISAFQNPNKIQELMSANEKETCIKIIRAFKGSSYQRIEFFMSSRIVTSRFTSSAVYTWILEVLNQ